MKNLIQPILSIFQERAFWLALVGFAATFYLFAQGQLEIDAVLLALNGLATAVGFTIGLRDAAGKVTNIGRVETGVTKLFSSRKFWVSVIAIAAAVAMFLTGTISAEQLANTVTWLLGSYIGADALEGIALSYRPR